MIGGSGADILFGDSGDDYLYSGDGDDVVDGGEGDDVIVSASTMLLGARCSNNEGGSRHFHVLGWCLPVSYCYVGTASTLS